MMSGSSRATLAMSASEGCASTSSSSASEVIRSGSVMDRDDSHFAIAFAFAGSRFG
jgi:hypothetical protein